MVCAVGIREESVVLLTVGVVSLEGEFEAFGERERETEFVEEVDEQGDTDTLVEELG